MLFLTKLRSFLQIVSERSKFKGMDQNLKHIFIRIDIVSIKEDTSEADNLYNNLSQLIVAASSNNYSSNL